MAIQMAPVAGIALRYGAVALAGFAAAWLLPRGRLDARVLPALDEAPEGFVLQKHDGELNAAGRWRRVLRLGRGGPGVRVDAAGVARIRVRSLR